MTTFKYTTNLFREFFKRWGSYLLLVGLVTLFVRVVLVPIVRFLATTIIGFGNIPYLSLDNWLEVFRGHPFVAIALILLAILIIGLVYLQYSFLVIGVNNIRLRKATSFKSIFIDVFNALKKLNISSFLIFIVYLAFVFPLLGNFYSSDLLAKFKVPIFVIDTIIANPLVDLIAILAFFFLLYFAIRSILALPLTMIEGQSLAKAIKESWQRTKHHTWNIFFKIVLLSVISTFLVYGWSNLLFYTQSWLDTMPKIAFAGAVINMLLLILGSMLFQGMLTVIYILFITNPLEFDLIASPKTLSRKMKLSFRIGAGLLFTAFLALMVAYNSVFLFGGFDYQPLLISHRGVDTANGVQNTIQSLTKTAKEHPDFVEMDIHETKDHQFVVMHDADLNALAGINKKVHDLTLDELKKTKIHENGFTTTISSFDDYLNTADRLNQKLIVEIKTTPQDSPQMLQNFMDKYARRLQREKHRIHSLTYSVVDEIHKKYPKIYTSLILPYTLVYPKTKLAGYTLEETTLDVAAMNQAARDKQAIWAWTVDDPDDMAQMMSLGVDGIITNNLTELKQVVKQQNDNPSYAQRLRNFGQTFADLTGETVEN